MYHDARPCEHPTRRPHRFTGPPDRASAAAPRQTSHLRVSRDATPGHRTSRLMSHPCELVRLRPRQHGGRASQPSPPISASVEVAPVLDLPSVHALVTPPSGLLLFVRLHETVL